MMCAQWDSLHLLFTLLRLASYAGRCRGHRKLPKQFVLLSHLPPYLVTVQLWRTCGATSPRVTNRITPYNNLMQSVSQTRVTIDDFVWSSAPDPVIYIKCYVVDFLPMLNFITDPIIYGIRMRDIRQAYRRLAFAILPSRWFSDHSQYDQRRATTFRTTVPSASLSVTMTTSADGSQAGVSLLRHSLMSNSCKSWSPMKSTNRNEPQDAVWDWCETEAVQRAVFTSAGAPSCSQKIAFDYDSYSGDIM